MTTALSSGLSPLLLGHICFFLDALMIFDLITCGCGFVSIERDVERIKAIGKNVDNSN